MDAKQLLQIIREIAPCSYSLEITRPDADFININEYGQVYRQHPTSRGRDNFELTIDQDGIDILAKHLTERYGL